MASNQRSAFQQQYIEALIESKAINLDAVGSTLSKFGERALLEGEDLVHIVNRKVVWNCGWPGPIIDLANVDRVNGQINQ